MRVSETGWLIERERVRACINTNGQLNIAQTSKRDPYIQTSVSVSKVIYHIKPYNSYSIKINGNLRYRPKSHDRKIMSII